LRRGGSVAALKEKVSSTPEATTERSAVADKVIRQCDVGKTE
jgi:hypothetical protein